MKALIISDKQEIIDTFKSFLSENNYDIIVYRWLLKALDNIEEIQPDMIILSASEYPRHWKTLASFVQSGIGGNAVKVFLYEPEPLSDDDKKKAEQLGIKDCIESLSVEQLGKLIDSSDPVPENIKIEIKQYELIITHPVSGKFLFGKASIAVDSDEFMCELPADYNFTENQFIKFVSVFDKVDVKAFSAEIIECNSKILKLKVKEYYEEEI